MPWRVIAEFKHRSQTGTKEERRPIALALNSGKLTAAYLANTIGTCTLSLPANYEIIHGSILYVTSRYQCAGGAANKNAVIIMSKKDSNTLVMVGSVGGNGPQSIGSMISILTKVQ